MPGKLLRKKTKTAKNGNGTAASNGNGSYKQTDEERNRLHAWIVGPDAPPGQKRPEDPDLAKQFDDLDSMRKVVVQVGKRMGTLKVDEAREAPSVAPNSEEDGASLNDGLMASNRSILPPFDFVTLSTLFENSSSLRQNIDAMATNIDGFGHQFTPVLDFQDPQVDDQIRDILMRQRIESGEDGAPDDLMDLTDEQLEAADVSIEEVQKTKKRWQTIASLELGRAQSFFEFINPLEPLTEVRKKMRQQKELLGNAAWEVIREDPADVKSKISQVYEVPFVNVRLLRADKDPVETEMMVRKDPISFDTIKVQRYFRRFVRTTGSHTIYYKEFGDPRVVDRSTGEVFESLEAMQKKNAEAKPAHELFHWQVPSPISAYGVPRWIGALLSVLGSRAAEEVNFLFFDNKAIPPMVLMVSGGRVSEQAVQRLESYFEDKVKGRENFHKIMIIEAIPADADVSEGDLEHSGKLRMELKPLMREMQQDALFQDYDANNIKKIGRSFRQPPLMTGDTRDMNRSTAEVAKALAEEQIYQPERDAFDAVMDRHFLTNLKIHFWRFKTNAPVQRIPTELVDNAKKALDAGGITANEARKLFSDAFSIPLPFRNEDWAKTPPKLVLQAARQGAVPSAEPTDGEGARAAEEVTASAGEVVAAGFTSTDGPDEHRHRFVITRDEGKLVATILFAGEDRHIHEVEVTHVEEGTTVEVATSEVNDHSHKLSFTVPLSKRARRMNAFASLVHALRNEVQNEIEAAKDDFFDPSNWDDE